MPYCPKCDMEFVEGITVCTDCGGELVSSKEEYLRMKKEEEDAARARLQKEFSENEEKLDKAIGEAVKEQSNRHRAMPQDDVYVSKADRYEDYSSSGTAFIIVGVIILIAAVLCFCGVLPLPFYGSFRLIMLGLMAVIGVACLAVSFRSFSTARVMKGEAAEEKKVTDDLMSWFLENFTAASLDKQISSEVPGEQRAEERALKRLNLIQDILITNFDITDQAYTDELAEEIYDRLFDD